MSEVPEVVRRVDARFDLVILPPKAGRIVPMEGGEPRPAASAGSVLRGPDGLALEIAEFWLADPAGADQVGLVQVAQQLEGPDRTRMLIDRRRIGIYRRAGAYFVELNIVSCDPAEPGRLGTFKTASRENLEAHLEESSLSYLFAESRGVESRATLLGDTGARRNRLAVAFESIESRVPTVALVTTAIIPTWAFHGAVGDKACL